MILKVKTAAKVLLLLLISYQVMRLLFLLNNLPNFDFSSIATLFNCFFYGLQFDLSAIAYSNGLYFILLLLPLRITNTNTYQRLLNVVLLLGTIPCFLFNFVDIAYFHFTQKRTTADFFSVITMGSDLQNMLPSLLKDYWLILLSFLIFCTLFIKIVTRIMAPSPLVSNHYHKNKKYWLIPIITLSLLILAARGGIQFKPLSILSAANHTSTQHASVVLNTSFTIIRTFGKEELTEIEIADNEAEQLSVFNPIHKYGKNAQPFKKLNVVVIIMESFSKEYIGYFNNGNGYTPFLDSLITNSIICSDAFANGKKSIEGIPAVLCGIPALMNNPYISSVYNGNQLNSLPLLLKKYGYASAFFHGGNNGTMGFESFSHMAGYEKYVGRNEYGNKDYDGTWGIYDEPFFNYFCAYMSEMKEPFTTAFFSLSSHHPYSLPAHLKERFEPGKQPIHKAIRYADYSLSQFFKCAKQQTWYNNTLFVITADHTGPSMESKYQSHTGIYEVPIIYFAPGDTAFHGVVTKTTQQLDIVPSTLDYLNFDEPFKFFGNSVFDSLASPWALNYLEGTYQLITPSHTIYYDFEKTSSVKNREHTADSKVALQNQEDLLRKLKILVHQFNHALIHNKLRQN
jgi:phosphoglycerol transferase MdoB-like AlkP superfamily enzyme